MHIRAIETRYKGYRFRSRLEARWAVFFDALGLRWEYEKEGFDLPSGRYLPDFFVHWDAKRTARLLQFREVGYWVEIKGTAPSQDELAKLSELCAGTGHIGYLLAGPPDQVRVWVSDHQGQFAEWENARLNVGWLAFVDCCPIVRPTGGSIAAAIEASRSARFEHGESGPRGGRG